jgi:mono/diheme cytochrome c family protein
MRSIVAAFLAMILWPEGALAQEGGDPSSGRDLSVKLCADCHGVLREDRASPVIRATRFSRIASTRGMTAMALDVWLQTSHPSMPNIRLTVEQSEDIIAYIMSLKEKAASEGG